MTSLRVTSVVVNLALTMLAAVSPSAAEVRLIELPAYTVWCSSITVDGGEKAEERQAEMWASFLKTVDSLLVAQSIAASGLPFAMQADMIPADDARPARIKQEACVVVPPDAKLDAGSTSGSLARRSVAPLEKVVVKVCPSGTPVACLDALRAEVQAALPTVGRDTIETWPFRLAPFGSSSDETASIREALLATDARPVAPPVTVQGTITRDQPERQQDGKPLLRPLRLTPTGSVTPKPRPTPPSVVAAITVPATIADGLRNAGQ